MKVLFLLDLLKDSQVDWGSFSFSRKDFIAKMIENATGCVKIGDSVQTHAEMYSNIYALFGGTEQHKNLLSQFLEDHNEWKNLGMDMTAFYECEEAVLFNSDKMHYNVWVPL